MCISGLSQEQGVGNQLALLDIFSDRQLGKGCSEGRKKMAIFLGLSSNSSNVPPNKTATKQ